MNSKTLLLLLLVTVAAIAVAHAEEQERVRPAVERTDADIQRQDVTTPKESGQGSGEKVATLLEPGLAQIEAEYSAQMDALRSEISLATTPEHQDELQRRAEALKLEWTLALADRAIELAREREDAEAEAEAMQAKEAILNPRPVKHTPVERDPNAGISIQGGAR